VPPSLSLSILQADGFFEDLNEESAKAMLPPPFLRKNKRMMPRRLTSGEFASISLSETFSADFVHAQELVGGGVTGSPGGTRELLSRQSCEGGGAGRGDTMRVVVQNPPAVRRTVAGRWKERLRVQSTGAVNEHNEQGVHSKKSKDVVLIDHHGDLSKTTLDSEVRGREGGRE
jgi:hypothetical protein